MTKVVEQRREQELAFIEVHRTRQLKLWASEADGLDNLGYHAWAATISNLRAKLERAFAEAIEDIHEEASA